QACEQSSEIDVPFSSNNGKLVQLAYRSTGCSVLQVEVFQRGGIRAAITPRKACLQGFVTRYNMALIRFLVYSQIFPSLLRNRIKLRESSHHWNALDPTSDRGRNKVEQRRGAFARLQRIRSTRSVVKETTNVLLFMKMDKDEFDERHRFFMQREFSVFHGERGEVHSLSVDTSCCSTMSLLYFSTV
ncbi:unnamed protein product, partial [Hapterophycus canaliculatus]